jgi:outer membrane protein assembly factor BamD (BamD/ComL family)
MDKNCNKAKIYHEGENMQRIIIFIGSVTALFLILSCSETKTEEEYYLLANEQYGQEAYADAIENFKIILEKFPEGETTAQATFMLGFIYANSLENLEEAKKYYTLFIEKYPDNDLADDAQYELNNLGQDVNDLPIFKDIESEEKASTEE